MYLAPHGCLSNLAECKFLWLGVSDKDQGAALGHVHQIRGKKYKKVSKFFFSVLLYHIDDWCAAIPPHMQYR
jgi:hypothetical protein